MLYNIDEEVVAGKKTAVLTCRKCEYKEPITDDNPLVYEHILRDDKTTRLAMNPYLKNDPTLDHLTNIVCPNTECPSKSGKPSDIVPVKISEKQLIWVYQCANCDATWKQASRVV